MKLVKQCFLVILSVFVILTNLAYAADFKILIMQDDKGAVERFQPILNYLKKNGITASMVSAPNYPHAAKMFVNGEADAMFSGSGLAGTLIIKDIAIPTVRPVSKDGSSTYKAVILAPKGAPKFTDAKYFAGKKVVFSGLAAAGEFYYRSIPNIKNVNANIILAASHGAAIEALARGAADIAIAKDKVWDKRKEEFSNLEKVGEDKGENPDMTLMLSKKVNKDLVTKVTNILLGINNDNSPEALEVKNKLNADSFIKTTQKDFNHTLDLLKRAGVTKDFNFSF